MSGVGVSLLVIQFLSAVVFAFGIGLYIGTKIDKRG